LTGFIKSGLGHAQESAIQLAWQEGQLWMQMVKYYAGEEQTIEVEALAHQAELTCQQTSALQAHLSKTWWECFDMGRTGLIRAHLIEFQERMSYINDWLKGLGAAMRDEDFGETHDAFMQKVGGPMLELSSCTAQLLYRSSRLAIAGYGLDDSKRPDFQEDLKELHDGMVQWQRRRLFSRMHFGRDAKRSTRQTSWQQTALKNIFSHLL